MKKVVGWREVGVARQDCFHDSHVLKGLVVRAVNSVRPREYCSGIVFDIEAEDVHGVVGHVFFFDKWAHAASFITVGDEVTLEGFVIRALPCRIVPSELNQPAAPAELLPAKRQDECFAHPGTASVLTVAQQAEQGDTIELTVTSQNFEEPTARVRSTRQLTDTMVNDGDGSRQLGGVVHA